MSRTVRIGTVHLGVDYRLEVSRVEPVEAQESAHVEVLVRMATGAQLFRITATHREARAFAALLTQAGTPEGLRV